MSSYIPFFGSYLVNFLGHSVYASCVYFCLFGFPWHSPVNIDHLYFARSYLLSTVFQMCGHKVHAIFFYNYLNLLC